MEKRRLGIMILYIFIGAVAGTVLGIGMGKVFPFMNIPVAFGLSPFTLHLVIFDITFGFNLYLNAGTILGIILFFYLFLIL